MGDATGVILRELQYLLFTSAGVVVGVIAMHYLLTREKIVNTLSKLGGWITRLSGLPGQCSLPFVASLFSPSTGSSMLATMYSEGRLSRRELYIASLINTFPAFLSHLRTLVPVLLSTMGLYGLIYLGLLVSIGLIQMTIFAASGKAILKGRRTEARMDRDTWKVRSSLNLRRVARLLLKMISTMTIVGLAFTALDVLGLGETINSYLSRALGFLDSYAVGIVVAYMVSDTAAFAAAGTLLNGGYSGTVVLEWLLIGYAVSSLFRGLRHNAPYYLGVYGPRDGLLILLISTSTRALIALSFLGALRLVQG